MTLEQVEKAFVQWLADANITVSGGAHTVLARGFKAGMVAAYRDAADYHLRSEQACYGMVAESHKVSLGRMRNMADELEQGEPDG